LPEARADSKVQSTARNRFDMTIERQPDAQGDCVKVTLSGKFLPYKEYEY
jgi:cyanate lyase